MNRSSRGPRLILLKPVLSALALCALAACERIMQNMYDQPRDKPYSANSFFENGASARDPVPNTVARAYGARAGASSGRRGYDDIEQQDIAESATQLPTPLSEEVLLRGQERYSIYCLPCHSPVGDGDGRIVRRGFPAPPTYHSDRLRDAPDRHFFDVISKGYGVMHAYGDRVKPTDRWAIVAYIRALQRSQYARLDALPEQFAAQATEALKQTTGQKEQP